MQNYGPFHFYLPYTMLDLYSECLRPQLNPTCPPNINNPNTDNPSPSSHSPHLSYTILHLSHLPTAWALALIAALGSSPM